MTRPLEFTILLSKNKMMEWVVYEIVESPYCTPETNITLYVNYIEIKILKRMENQSLPLPSKR